MNNSNKIARNENDNAKSSSNEIKSLVTELERKSFNIKGLQLNMPCIIMAIAIFPLEIL